MTDIDEDWALLSQLPSSIDPDVLVLREAQQHGAFMVVGTKPKTDAFLKLFSSIPLEPQTVVVRFEVLDKIIETMCVDDASVDQLVDGFRELDKIDPRISVDFRNLFEMLHTLTRDDELFDITPDVLVDMVDTFNHDAIPERDWCPQEYWNILVLFRQFEIFQRLIVLVLKPKNRWTEIEQWVRLMEGNPDPITLMVFCTGDEDLSDYPAITSMKKMSL